MNAVWLTSEPFYSVAVWLLKSAWMSNYTTRCPSPSSCVSCVIEYCYWTGHSRTLDSAPLLWDTELALDLWWRAAELDWERAEEKQKPSECFLFKKETDFSLDHNSSVAEREAVCWGQKTKQTLGLISALLSAGSHLCCGCNHWWQEQPELTAWSPPRLSLGVATPY